MGRTLSGSIGGRLKSPRSFRASGVLPHDFSDTLRLLNEARKVATYEGDEPDLEGRSLEEIAADVETAVELAEQEAAS
jgi:hypothetical protein